jgi:beta-lactamase class A
MKKSIFVLFMVLALVCLSSVSYAAEGWKEKIAEEIAAVTFDAGVFIYNVADNDKFEHNSDKRFSSASIIKLFILNELFNQVKTGEAKLSDVIVFDHNVAVDGGMLHKFSSGASLRLEDLALFMLAVSDNTATNILIDHLGMEKINASIQALGAKETVLGRKMLDFEARKAGRDNYTSAAEVGNLLTGFLKEDPRVLDMLSLQKDRSKLPGNLGFDDADDLEPVIANKTGELPNHYHDAAIFFYATPRPVVAVVLTGGVPHLSEGNQFIARIGKIIYDAFLVK